MVLRWAFMTSKHPSMSQLGEALDRGESHFKRVLDWRGFIAKNMRCRKLSNAVPFCVELGPPHLWGRDLCNLSSVQLWNLPNNFHIWRPFFAHILFIFIKFTFLFTFASPHESFSSSSRILSFSVPPSNLAFFFFYCELKLYSSDHARIILETLRCFEIKRTLLIMNI